MNDPHQIAADLDDTLVKFARRKIPVLSPLRRKKARIAIIQAAIEKALNQTTIGQLVEKQIKARAAHASDLIRMSDGNYKIGNPDEAAHASEPLKFKFELHECADGKLHAIKPAHAGEAAEVLNQGWVTRGTVGNISGTCHIRITEQERRDIIAALQSRAAYPSEP